MIISLNLANVLALAIERLRYNRHNRRKYSLKVHIVLVTKYRKKLLASR